VRLSGVADHQFCFAFCVPIIHAVILACIRPRAMNLMKKAFV
jgi:hypothetical protein